MKDKKFSKALFKSVLPALALTASVGITIVPAGCRTPVEGISFLEGDFSVPRVEDFLVQDEHSVRLVMSKAVCVQDARLSDADGSDFGILCSLGEGAEATASVSGADSSAHGTANRAPSGQTAAFTPDSPRIGSSAHGTAGTPRSTSVTFNFDRPTQTGREYSLWTLLEDSQGNTLTLTIPFTGYNPRLPKIVLSEIRHTKFSIT